jgi:hypothetical protein
MTNGMGGLHTKNTRIPLIYPLSCKSLGFTDPRAGISFPLSAYPCPGEHRPSGGDCHGAIRDSGSVV